MSIVLSLLLVAAQQPAPLPGSAPTTAVDDSDQRMICKYDAKTGTRFKSKSCKTKAEWDAIREQSIRDAREQIDSPRNNMQRGG